MQKPYKILVIGPAWVGDMVMANALYQRLHQLHPGCELEVVAPAWSLPLLARMDEVQAAHALEVGHGQFGLGARWQLGKTLRGRAFDQAIVLPRSLKAALVPFFAKAKVRTGYKGESRYGLLNDIRPLDKSVLTQTVQRYVALGEARDATLPPPIPQPRLRVDTEAQAASLERLGLTPGAVAFCPGAEYGPAKQWPVGHWRALAEQLSAAGETVWLVGSDKDHAICAEIAEGLTDVHNLCGQTRLVEAVDLLAAARAVVSNDSGLMHVTAAVGTPLVALYGSSTPDYTPPLTERARVLYRHLKCSPCFERVCPLGHTNCLTGIRVEQVTDALARLT